MRNLIVRVMKHSGWQSLIIAITALSVAACQASAPTQAPADAAPNPSTMPAVSATGKVVPAEWTTLSFRISGQVNELLVDEGDVVKAGDVIARLDDHDQQQMVSKADLAVHQGEVKVASAQHNLDIVVGWTPNKGQLNAAVADAANAEAAVKAAQSDYDKAAYLPWVSSTQQSMALEQATNNYNKARANLDFIASNRPDVMAARNALEAAKLTLSEAQLELDNARTALDRTSLRAPLAGVVSGISMHPGEFVNAGQPVVVLGDLTSLQVETTDLNEIDVARIQAGDSVTVTFDALPGEEVKGDVIRIAPRSSDGAGVNYTVYIRLDRIPEALRWGMTAFVAIVAK